MGKTCSLCNNKIKDKEDYCLVHSDKPRGRSKKQIEKRKQEIEELLREQGKNHQTGYMAQIGKFMNDISKHFEKEKRRFQKIEEDYKEVMKICEELYDGEYQVIPNKLKEYKDKNGS